MHVRMLGSVISAAGVWQAGDIADLPAHDAQPLLDSGAAEPATLAEYLTAEAGDAAPEPEPEPQAEGEAAPEPEAVPADDGGV